MTQAAAPSTGLITAVGAWLAHPFEDVENGDILDWVLIFGLLILIAFFWQMVLLHIREV